MTAAESMAVEASDEFWPAVELAARERMGEAGYTLDDNQVSWLRWAFQEGFLFGALTHGRPEVIQ